MADISRITLPSGTTYEIKDAVARQQIGNTIMIRGTTTTPLTDESTTNPIIIDGNEYRALANDAVFYKKAEYVFDGTRWHEFGDMSGLGELAKKNSASGNYTPEGNVSQPTFTGETAEIQVEGTPTGTVSQPTFSGTPATMTVAGTAVGEISQPTFAGSLATINVKGTPTGEVSQPTFTGDALTSTGSYTPDGNVVISEDDDGNYQPVGTVTAPQISVKTAGATTTVNSITDVGTLPTLTTTVENENLTISFNRGALPTKGEDISVKTGDAEYQATTPAFHGSKVQLGFAGKQGNIRVSGTPTGTVSQPAFTGEELTSTGSYTPAGIVSKPTFTGEEFTSTGEFTPAGTVSQPVFEGDALVSTGEQTPSGTISQPTFTGTPATITVS